MIRQILADWTLIGVVSLGLMAFYLFIAGLIGRFIGLSDRIDEERVKARQHAFERSQWETRKRMQALMHGRGL